MGLFHLGVKEGKRVVVLQVALHQSLIHVKKHLALNVTKWVVNGVILNARISTVRVVQTNLTSLLIPVVTFKVATTAAGFSLAVVKHVLATGSVPPTSVQAAYVVVRVVVAVEEQAPPQQAAQVVMRPAQTQHNVLAV